MIVDLILIILVILIILCWSYFFIRNNKVCYFIISLNDSLFDELRRILNTYKDDGEFHKDKNNFDCIEEKVLSLLNKRSYNKYLFSFKSFKLEK